MDRLERIFKLHQILSNYRQPVSMRRLQAELGEPLINIKRSINHLRAHFNAPIEYDRGRNGYYYDSENGQTFELPGLWFSSAELYALIASEQLLAEVQPGLFESMIAPLRERIEKILATGNNNPAEIGRRVRILRIGGRKAQNQIFQRVTSALIERIKLHIHYRARSGEKDETTERIISPQRLVHYRDNWYLDAWCHKKHALRTFTLDRILEAHGEKDAAKNISETRLNAHFVESYGIFSGQPKHTAVLIFSEKQARWVAEEQWHPKQQGKFLAGGRYELRIPYASTPELVMDILKYGAEVEVIAPKTLRQEVAAKLREAAAHYA